MDFRPATIIAIAAEGGASAWELLRSPALWPESLVVRSIVALLVYVVLVLVLRLAIVPRIADPTLRFSVKKTGSYLLNGLFLLVLIALWMGDLVELSTFLGLVSAGLAISLHEPLTNLAGWVFLLVRKPFRVGDRIEISPGPAGDVIDVRLFMFSILEIGNWVDADQSTGRIIHVPNGVVFNRTIANFTQGFEYIWNELPVTITFESDWERAHEVLTRIAQEEAAHVSESAQRAVAETTRKYLIFYKKLTPIVWVSVADSGVTLTVRYLCEARKRRSSATSMWTAILRAFGEEPEIDLAYPTQRIFSNLFEGKPDLGGPKPEA